MFSNRQRMIGRSARGGFTMVEVILVVVIILILASVVVPRVVGQSTKARIKSTKIGMAAIKTALQNFEVNAGRFPTTSEGLEALINRPSGLSKEEWPDKYVDSMPKDAWGNPFHYVFPSEHGLDFDLVSGGQDKKIGTSDDITNWEDVEKR